MSRLHCAYVCIYMQAWSRLCVPIRAGMIALMCAYTRGHDHAYLCIHAWAWSRLSVHARVGIIAPICAYTRISMIAPMCACTRMSMMGPMCAYTRMSMIAPMCPYTRRHDRAFVHIYVQLWLCLCEHITAVMIWAHECMYTWSWLCLCVHICVGIITPVCDYKCRHDWCIYVQAW